MKIQLETNYLMKVGLSPTLYVLYSILKNGSVDEIESYLKKFGPFSKKDLKKLVNVGLIKVNGKISEEIELTEISNFYDEEDDPSLWVDEFIDIFPSATKNKAGYYIKGNKKEALPKLEKFVKKYQEYSNKDLILDATKNYIKRQAMDGFQMCKLMLRFIEKDGESTLAAECQAILDGNNKKESEKTELI